MITDKTEITVLLPRPSTRVAGGTRIGTAIIAARSTNMAAEVQASFVPAAGKRCCETGEEAAAMGK